MSTLEMDFFLKTEKDICLHEILKVKDEIASVRRGMFARHGELYKAIADMQKTIEYQQKEIERLKHDKEFFCKTI